jgi:hypothetical protein
MKAGAVAVALRRMEARAGNEKGIRSAQRELLRMLDSGPDS